jgi:CRISPR/Cas system CMR-associated protein Cmr5 small subunit
MQNLEQIRARNAITRFQDVHGRQGEGNALAGYPSLIINNGLLATVAFSIQKGDQMLRIANAIGYHLSNLHDGQQNRNLLQGCSADADGVLNRLSAQTVDATLLQECTAEALAFLSYLKRFA